jgi:dimethylhistidine N-methyltransferase
MTPTQLGHEIESFAPGKATFREEVLAGLRRPQKQIPCKYLYDEEGARLFEAICELPEYYPTRTELGIMRENVSEMADQLGPDSLIIEYGSGEGIKTRILLEALERPAAYVPIDIACPQLAESARTLRERFPDLEVAPVCADYTGDYRVPETRRQPARRAVYFPGSTIGNFRPDEAAEFLGHIRQVCGQGGGLLVGVDLKKDRELLESAYNDAAGVTAQFNLNLLRRLERELDAQVETGRFEHHAFFDRERGRIELHLVSLFPQTLQIGEESFDFEAGETIHTENSYKYSLAEFADLARRAGFRVDRVWLDDRELFSVQYLEAA